MANDETENTKKDALLRDWLRDWKDAPSYVERAFGFQAGWNAGFDAGAASVDRVEIVREAFDLFKAGRSLEYVIEAIPDLYFYGNAAPPLAVPVSSGEAIPDLSEPWRPSPREQYYADLTEQLRKQVAALQPSLRIEQQYIGLTFWSFSRR